MKSERKRSRGRVLCVSKELMLLKFTATGYKKIEEREQQLF